MRTTIEISDVRTGETGVEGSWDVDVSVTYEAAHGAAAETVTRSGEVTLVARREITAYGDPDHWVSSALLEALMHDLGRDGLRSILSEIEAEAVSAIEASDVPCSERVIS